MTLLEQIRERHQHHPYYQDKEFCPCEISRAEIDAILSLIAAADEMAEMIDIGTPAERIASLRGYQVLRGKESQ